MQANCPQCGNRIVIDDAKVPDRPFKVKCPKCQNSVSFPGKAAGAAPAPEPEAPGAESQASAPPPDLSPGAAGVALSGRALVCLGGQSATVAALLSRLGCQVDTIEDPEEGARLLEQGIYDVVATNRAGAAPGKGETLYQRAGRLNPEGRRRVFLILIGDEFKSGDGTQAWAVSADLVLSPRDMAAADRFIRNTISERMRLYQVYLDARQRHEASAG